MANAALTRKQRTNTQPHSMRTYLSVFSGKISQLPHSLGWEIPENLEPKRKLSANERVRFATVSYCSLSLKCTHWGETYVYNVRKISTLLACKLEYIFLYFNQNNNFWNPKIDIKFDTYRNLKLFASFVVLGIENHPIKPESQLIR